MNPTTVAHERDTSPTLLDRAGEDPSVQQHSGRWDPVFKMPNVAIHTHLLPNGKVLFWGRRDDPGGSMHEHSCTPHVWTPGTETFTATESPALADGGTVNLFCSGHTFLPDGRLLVMGGHLRDGDGVNQACVFDPEDNSWTALPLMNSGRWYPTATSLPDGRVLVLSGSFFNGHTDVINTVPQIWDGIRWQSIADFVAPPLYPRMHVTPEGRVFMSGSNAATHLLDTHGTGRWSTLPEPGGVRPNGERQYGPAVSYEPGKVVYMGGGNDAGTDLPSAANDAIDLESTLPAWHTVASMRFPRRQHNATILADGTVLVTGGTSGPGFNDVSPGQPVHAAELWNPTSGTWTTLAAEDVDRCYHATALLLPDASVLSAGGGEWMVGDRPNDPADTHRDGQVFHPPYLFRGPRPRIDAAPDELKYGGTFTVEVDGPEIGRVTLLRLSSVTHSFNSNQRFNSLTFTAQGGVLEVTAPPGPEVCPPGHYMLFALSTAGVPSIASMVRIGSSIADAADAAGGSAAMADTARAPAHARSQPFLSGEDDLQDWDREAQRESGGSRVTIGLTAQCPYGLGACWGGAYEALSRLEGVAAVRPVANTADSTATIYLREPGLPNLEQWQEQFAHWANGSYAFRGVEVELDGTVHERNGDLYLKAPNVSPPVRLEALQPGQELAWDLRTRHCRNASEDEHAALERLVEQWRRRDADDLSVRVTGPIRNTDSGWSLSIRLYEDT